MVDRRRFLEILAALGVAQAIPARATDHRVSFDSYPFTLGVASGYPTPDGFVLWTRLATKPLEQGGGLAPEPMPVRWEVAADDAMRRVIASGVQATGPAWAHALHVDVQGLEPERWYWYRFSAGDAQSPVGRTRTAPLAATVRARLRFAFASCQHYEQGYFGAYRHIIAGEPDLVRAVHPGERPTVKPSLRRKDPERWRDLREPNTYTVGGGFHRAIERWEIEHAGERGEPTGRTVRPHMRRAHSISTGPARGASFRACASCSRLACAAASLSRSPSVRAKPG
jgi:hypothetical protein